MNLLLNSIDKKALRRKKLFSKVLVKKLSESLLDRTIYYYFAGSLVEHFAFARKKWSKIADDED